MNEESDELHELSMIFPRDDALHYENKLVWFIYRFWAM